MTSAAQSQMHAPSMACVTCAERIAVEVQGAALVEVRGISAAVAEIQGSAGRCCCSIDDG